MVRVRRSALCSLWTLKLRTFRLAAFIAGCASACGVALFVLDDFFDWRLIASRFLDVREVVYGSLASFVGILLIFRTSHAYQRFWSGSSILQQVFADWYDATSTVIAFCRYSSAPDGDKQAFKQCLVRYVSLLNAMILADLEGHPDHDSAQALSFELLDPECSRSSVFRVLCGARGRPEIVFQWIQNLLVDSIKTGVLSIPAPLLTRAFQELGKGMLHPQGRSEIF